MPVPPSFRARRPRAAARTAAVVLGLCAGMLGVVAIVGPLGPQDTDRAVVVASAVGLLGAAALFARVPADRLDRAGAFVVLAVGGVSALCALSLTSGSSSTRTQAFLAFAVLYAGLHLRPAAAAVATGSALVAGAVMLAHSRPLEAAATDFLFFGPMLAVVGISLSRAGGAQERLVDALRRQADVDALTGLVTRRVLDRALDRHLSRDGGEGAALVLVDIDSFKQINDVHGHPVGDDALVHLAGILRGQIRAGDAVISRLGGDELAVLLPGCPPETAARRAEELLAAVRAAPLALPDGTLLALSVSVGVAHVPRHASGMRGLYAAADAALYRAKRAGRSRVEVAVGAGLG